MDTAASPIPGLEPVLTTSELAAHLGVPVQTIHDLRHSHRGPRGFRVGRELRYLFLRLGWDGYYKVQKASQDVAVFLSGEIAKIPAFELWNDGTDIPVFAWTLRDGYTDKWNLYHLSERLRLKGWLVPAYPMPDDLAQIVVQRIVVRNGLSRNLAESLLSDIREAVEYLDALESPMPTEGLVTSFTH